MLDFEYISEAIFDEQDGVFFIENIRQKYKTCLKKDISFTIFNMIEMVIKKYNISKLLHYSNGPVGYFNTVKSHTITNFFSSSAKLFMHSEVDNYNNRLLLVEPSPYQYLKETIPNQQKAPIFDEDIISLLSKANETDMIFMAVTPQQYSSVAPNCLRAGLKRIGLFVHAIFCLSPPPSETLSIEETRASSEIFPWEEGILLLILSKKTTVSEFVGSFYSQEQARTIFEKFDSKITEISSGSFFEKLKDGLWLPPEYFKSKRHLQLTDAIFQYKSDFKKYNTFKMDEFFSRYLTYRKAENTRETKEKEFLYFKIDEKSGEFLSSLVGTCPNPDDNFLVEFNFKDELFRDYIHNFFLSEFGQFLIEHISSAPNASVALNELRALEIPVPTKEEQKNILKTLTKLKITKKKLEELNMLQTDVIFSPNFSPLVAKRLDQILEIYHALSDGDKLRRLILQGENKALEFKESLCLDVKKGTKEKYIEDAAIKTIAAFLNSDGGTLLIGVNDGGCLIGLNKEISMFFPSEDRFLLHVKNLIHSRIGPEFYPYINQKIIKIDDRIILEVQCRPSDREVYVDGREFFVRTNPATDKLEGPKLVNYVKIRFK